MADGPALTGARPPEGGPPPKLLDRVRTAVRLRHYSRRTEQAYVDWIRRYIVFHHKKHPSAMGAAETALGDPVMRTRRLKAVRGTPRLALTDRATELANQLVHRGALPKRATVDGFHIAIAAAHQVDYLLTWNCKHLANATMRGTIEDVCRSEGLNPPIICTPEELPSGSSA